jgi:predicted RNase H-like HicB family nuclease
VVDEVKRYTARYEFDGQHWLVEIEEIPQVHTFGRTLAKADANVRDALALWLDAQDGDALQIVPNIQLDPIAIDAVSRANQARSELHELQVEVNQLTADAARLLVEKLNLSLRDVGFLLNLSHQRVAQLLEK